MSMNDRFIRDLRLPEEGITILFKDTVGAAAAGGRHLDPRSPNRFEYLYLLYRDFDQTI
jgi:hypothetical protein